MLIKAIVLGAAALSTPIVLVSTHPEAQGPGRGPAPDPIDAVHALQRSGGEDADLIQLRGKYRDAIRRVADAETRAAELQSQLEECMTFLLDAPVERSSCSRQRSRGRSLMTYYQWMKGHGHDAHADLALQRIVESYGDDTDRLNSLAWHLMTDESTAGQFDELALAVAERMQKSRRMKHQHIDTVALAKFLGGEIDEAIALQKKAIAKGGRSDDYRRRLRTYEAAKQVADARATAPVKTPADRVAETEEPTATLTADTIAAKPGGEE